MKPDDVIRGLPGEVLIRQGIADFLSSRSTIAACLVGVARTRLHRSGLLPDTAPSSLPDAERHLYALLREGGGDAYSRYNSLLRELVSFEQALDRRLANDKEKAEMGMM